MSKKSLVFFLFFFVFLYLHLIGNAPVIRFYPSFYEQMNKEPGSIKLFPWPCAPKAILDMVEKCTSWNPSERPSLESLKESLQHMEDADGAGEGIYSHQHVRQGDGMLIVRQCTNNSRFLSWQKQVVSPFSKTCCRSLTGLLLLLFIYYFSPDSIYFNCSKVYCR